VRWLVLAVVAVLVAGACGDDTTVGGDGGDPTEVTGTTATTAAETTGATGAPAGTDDPYGSAEAGRPDAAGSELDLVTTAHGEVLVDEAGMALYLFLPDERSDSTCYDQCATAWPPRTTVEGVGDQLDASLLGTTERTDGSTQATYNGWPLYYYAADAGPGDVNGQGVGDVWYLVGADGEPVGATTS
jgi:predicted lipoprotein with Yx(FWY)xxD motif